MKSFLHAYIYASLHDTMIHDFETSSWHRANGAVMNFISESVMGSDV